MPPKTQKANPQTTPVPFEIWEVPFDGKIIKFHHRLVLPVDWLPDDPEEYDEREYLTVKYPQLAIDVFAETRDDLLDAVFSNIRMNWKLYVLREDHRLSPQTKAIKDACLAVAEVVDG